MSLPFFAASLLRGNCFPPLRDAMVRFLIKEIRILQRTLADQSVDRIICTPEERIALLSIGAEMDHNVKDIFQINAWQTYTRWLREEREGKAPGRPGRPRKFSDEVIALIIQIAKENIMAGFGKIVGEMKTLGLSISTGTIKAILRRHNITPPNDRQYTVTGNWRKFVANVDSLVACDFLSKTIYFLRASSMLMFWYSSISVHVGFG